jgi:hypothetical protein
LVILTILCGVRVQAESQASVGNPAVRFFDGSLRLWLACLETPVPEALQKDLGLLHARCPYSGRTLLSILDDPTNLIMHILLELGADATARDWQVSFCEKFAPSAGS